MTSTQSILFYFAEYILTALFVFLLTWKRTKLDLRKSISFRACFFRLAAAAGLGLLCVALMAGAYMAFFHFAPNSPRTNLILVLGIIQFLTVPFAYTLLFTAWYQRISLAPRGNWLSAVLILLYVISDLSAVYTAPTGIKFALLAVGSAAALFLPQAWKT